MIVNMTRDKETVYLQVIKESYPLLEIQSGRMHTSDGQFNDVLFINDDLIFRFPRYEKGIHDFLREIQILQKLKSRVSLPIPNPVYMRSEPNEVGSVFMGYRLLPGTPLFRGVLNEITDEGTLESLAQQLANFLYGLHHLYPATLGLELTMCDGLAESKTFFSEVREHLFPFMRPEARGIVTRHFEVYFNNPSLQEYEPSIIHGDFGGSNILYDRDKVTGIIDFSFARLDDPARDLAAVSTYGDDFFTRIRRHYPNIESLLERAKFHRGTFALYEALHGFRYNDKEAFASGMEEYV